MRERAPVIQPRSEADRIGFFGKLPTHGDFVSWGFGPDLERLTQDWLQAGLQSVREAMGEPWANALRGMPSWRFVIERDLWAPATLAGVLVPSTDRVGRSFPLMVLAQVQNFAQDPRQLCNDEAWFTAAEGIAESSLRRDFDIGQFTASLKRLRGLRADGDQQNVTASRRAPAVTLWWTAIPGTRQATGFRHPGPPQADDVLKLITHTGREQNAPPIPEPPPVAAARPLSSPPVAVVETDEVTLPAAPSEKPAADILSFEHGYSSHPGTRLNLNADALLASQTGGIFAVADGVGDGPSAVDAAKLCVHLLSEAAGYETLDTLVQEARGKLGRAHSLLQSRKLSSTNPSVAIASIVALLCAGGRFAVQWAGDARCYLMRDGMMRCLTRDHLDIGLKRRLARAIGMPDAFRLELANDDLQAGDRFLLCSAPLPKVLSERAIAEILLEETPQDAAKALVENGLIADCKDNLTALVVQVQRDARA